MKHFLELYCMSGKSYCMMDDDYDDDDNDDNDRMTVISYIDDQCFVCVMMIINISCHAR